MSPEGTPLGADGMPTDAISVGRLQYQASGERFSGFLAAPGKLSGLRPGIVVVHDAWGVGKLVELKAQMLAELGFIALAIDLYGESIKPQSLDECRAQVARFKADPDLLRARALAGLDALKELADVDADRLAVIGFCFGGMAALEMARAGAECAAIVSFHGLLTTSRPAHTGSVKAKILVCTGADDPLVPAADVDAFVREMREAEVDCQTIIYNGAQHSFANPFASSNPGIAHHPSSDRRSWIAMRNHFAEAFASST